MPARGTELSHATMRADGTRWPHKPVECGPSSCPHRANSGRKRNRVEVGRSGAGAGRMRVPGLGATSAKFEQHLPNSTKLGLTSI